MDERLYKATAEGNTESLLNLIQQDPLFLDRTNTSLTTHLETPLHIAAMLGHEKFVVELLKIKPGLARELDSRRSTALHLASAKGEVEIAKALLRVDADACFVCDRDGKNPLQVAAMMGRIEVLREMLVVKPEAAFVVMKCGVGGSVLHLCVEYCQFEALKMIVESVDFQDLVNCRDRNGNTVLHLAVADKQVETTEFLLSLPGMYLNAVNHSGMTAMDILIQRRRDVRDLEMEESLKHAGAIGVKKNIAPTFFHQNKNNHDFVCLCKNTNRIALKKQNKNMEDWLDKKRTALMVVASLIATMAFQVGVDPPSKVWENTQTSNSTQTLNNANDPKNTMYYVKKASNYMKKGETFYIVNTMSFIASLSIILLLMSGLPLKSRFFVWILMMITWMAISDIALSYTVAVIISTPAPHEKSINALVFITVFAWICLMSLLLFGHTVRLFVKTVKLLIKSLFGSRRRRRFSSDSAIHKNTTLV